MSTGESLKRGWRTELQLCPQVPTQHLIRISRANKWLLADSVGSCQRETQRPRIQQPVVPVRVSVESVNEPRWPDKRLPFSARFYHTLQACPLSLCFRYINYCQHLFAHLWPDNNSSYSKNTIYCQLSLISPVFPQQIMSTDMIIGPVTCSDCSLLSCSMNIYMKCSLFDCFLISPRVSSPAQWGPLLPVFSPANMTVLCADTSSQVIFPPSLAQMCNMTEGKACW